MLNQLLDASIGTIGGADGPTQVYLAGAIPENVSEALGMMGYGMLGIFVVIGLIAIIVALLGKVGKQR